MNQFYQYCYVCGEYTSNIVTEDLSSLVSKHQNIPVHVLISQILTRADEASNTRGLESHQTTTDSTLCLDCYEQIDLYDYGVWISKKTEIELKRVYKEKLDKELCTKDKLNSYEAETTKTYECLEEGKPHVITLQGDIPEDNTLSIDNFSLSDSYLNIDNNNLEEELIVDTKPIKKKPRNSYLKRRKLTDLDCKFCSLNFSSVTEVNQHLELHQGLHPLQCPICFKILSKKDALVRHMNIHTGTKRYLCFICGKSFVHYGSYDSHKLLHDVKNAKKYECKICGKVFIHHGSYHTHKLGHEGKKEKVCVICNKSFIRTSHLKRHKKTHAGLELYEDNLIEGRIII